MFTLNPLGLADAGWQHILMLIVAGTLGFIIGYVSRRAVINELESLLALVDRDLNDCEQGAIMVGAGEATNPDEALILNRIRARANQLDFDRIGFASSADSEDLKKIVGIGPFLERKLHAIGIYTFQQIANFTQDDVEKVNDIIEFFPGRIERDNWVGQAKELAKR